MKTVDINSMERVFQLIIEKLKIEGFKIINIDNDLYRYIPTESWDSFEKTEIDTGSLYDDIDNLLIVANNPKRPISYVDFDRMASLLRAISQKNNPI